jgi:hypothetical protein
MASTTAKSMGSLVRSLTKAPSILRKSIGCDFRHENGDPPPPKSSGEIDARVPPRA